MKFQLSEWRNMYDTVHALGKKLRDGKPTYDELGNYYPPVARLDRDELDLIEDQIKTLTQRSNRYLDQCGMKMPKPLWYHDRKDTRTWRSHESFKYEHLV